MVAYPFTGQFVATGQQFSGGYHHSRGAKSALGGVALFEFALKIGRFTGLRQPFYGRHFGSVGLDRQHQAAANRDAVKSDGTGAADPVLATQVRAGKIQIETQEIDQVASNGNLAGSRFAIDGDCDFKGFLGHDSILSWLSVL